MGLIIQVDGEEVYRQDTNVPMVHVFTPTGEAATVRCQGVDFGHDYDYIMNLVLDPAQGGIYLNDVTHQAREERREKLEGNETLGPNTLNAGLTKEQIEAQNQPEVTPESETNYETPSETSEEEGVDKEKEGISL